MVPLHLALTFSVVSSSWVPRASAIYSPTTPPLLHYTLHSLCISRYVLQCTTLCAYP